MSNGDHDTERCDNDATTDQDSSPSPYKPPQSDHPENLGHSDRRKLSMRKSEKQRRKSSLPCTPTEENLTFAPDRCSNASSDSLSTIITSDKSGKCKEMDENKYKGPSTCLSKSRIDKFHKLFHSVPEDENPIDSFSCAFVGDILLQGNLYISLNWICFYSNIRSRFRKIEIKMETVRDITPEKTALIIPNAIGVLTTDKRYVFGSFISRDHTYKFIRYLWKSFILSNQQSTQNLSDTPSHANNRDDKRSLSENASSVQMTTSLDETLEPDSLTLEQSDDAHDLTESDTTTSDKSFEDPKVLLPDTPPPQHRKIRLRQHHDNERHNEGFLVYHLFHSLDPRRMCKSLSQLAFNIQRIPRTNFLLAVCTVMVVLLLVSACLLMYKIMNLQAQLQTRTPWTATIKQDFSDLTHERIYNLHSKVHSATLEQLQTVLEANVQLLTQMSSSLKVLNPRKVPEYSPNLSEPERPEPPNKDESLQNCDNPVNNCS